MSITIYTENLIDCLDEMVPLLREHYVEVHPYPDKIPFNPDYEKYKTLNDQGLIHFIAVRDCGVMIGYCLAFLLPNLHYSDHVYAINDVIYLDKAYRHSVISDHMISYAEDCYKNSGASVMTLHMKTSVPFDGLCRRHNLEHIENIYMKYIGD